MGMKILRGCVVPVLVTALMAFPALAEDLPTAKTAHKQLYKTGKRATVVRILREDLIPEALLPAIKMAARIQKYYEAMAVSPTEGMQSRSAFQAINHHTVEAAHAAAIAGCNAKKKKASEDCVVVAEFLPKAYKAPRAFSLSALASAEFSKKYRRSGKSKAFAISPSTGHWGRAVKAASPEEARAAALAECAELAAVDGGKDCVVVSQD